jgi:hypothetical protein
VKGESLEDSWNNWELRNGKSSRRLRELEAENNRLFISVYGLDLELRPDETSRQMSLYKSDREEDIKRLLSFIVGCVMGRYSLDEPGLRVCEA